MIVVRLRLVAGAVGFVSIASCARAQQFTAPGDDTGRPLLTAQRIASLPEAERAAWTSYIDRSRRLHDADTAAVNAELRATGLTTMRKAPYRGPELDLVSDSSAAWFQSNAARDIALAITTFQTPSGGWSKRTDMSKPRAPGMSYYSETEAWHYIPTLDNGATLLQLAFLQRMAETWRDGYFVSAYRRGIAYVLAAQEPNGCWPQSYPLEGGYHDAITFNDDATVRVLRTLEEAGKAAIATAALRDSAQAAVRRGIACLLTTQVVVNGKRTVWGQQHDPITLEVVPARRYELAGLSGRESASVMTYLMSLPTPGSSVIAAVDAAAEFFRANAISGYKYDFRDGLSKAADGPLLWARLYEIGTNRPIFANRDGVKLYDWNQLTDRRTGYAWFGTEPANALRQYDKWKRLDE